MPARKKTGSDWEEFARTRPYFAVLTGDEYRPENLDKDRLEEFFESGKNYIDLVFRSIRERLDPDFHPSRALDFGCGVGRLVVPLASRCDHVVGVDVSDSMLRESRRNCEQRGISNVDFLQTDGQSLEIPGSFDLVHSIIVFQHIPCHTGEILFKQLIDLLAENGIGVVQFTYFTKDSKLRRLGSWARRSLPFVHNLLNVFQGRHLAYPLMQMNSYNLNKLFMMLQISGCHHAHIRFTGHDKARFLGVIIFFQKKALGVIRPSASSFHP